MTDSTWSASIEDALAQLDKTAWRNEVDALCERFDGINSPTSIREDIEISLWMLVKLVQTSDSKVIPVARLFQRRVAELDCWMHRAVKSPADKSRYFKSSHFWNPLVEPFKDFSTASTREYTASCPYPAQDVIRKWCESRFP